MWCEHCGQKLEEGDMFCVNCGANVSEPVRQNGSYYNGQYGNEPYSEEPKGNRNKTLCIILCIVVILGVLGFTAYLIKSDKDKKEADKTAFSVSDTKMTDVTQSSSPTESESDTDHWDETNAQIEKATYFVGAKASSVLPNQKEYSYIATNVLIDDQKCWCENADDLGIGEWIELELPKKQLLCGLNIINGYAGTEKQYLHNSKITDICIEFSDGRRIYTTLSVYDVNNRHKVQTIVFDEPVETSSVRIIIRGVSEGECKDTCLTYVCPYVN